MVKIEIHVPCKENECLMENPTFFEICDKLRSENIIVNLIKYENNKLPIGQLYNEILIQRRKANENIDYLIFMHSDALFNVVEVINHLQNLKNKYDIVGFAGAKTIDLKKSPLTWFTASQEYESTRYGRVIQDISKIVGSNEPKMSESFFNIEKPEVTDTAVASIDGCCMILTSKAWHSDILFDNNLLNDFYDLDFCLNARLNYGFSIGVIVDRIVHNSVGMAILSPEYKEKEKVFREKWHLAIP